MLNCSVDVTMSKIMDAIAEIVPTQILIARNATTAVQDPVRRDEVVSGELMAEKANRQTLPGGWLVATYTLAAQGKLYRTNEFAYQPDPPTEQAQKALGADILHEVFEATHQYTGCQVCYDLLLDPVTTCVATPSATSVSHEAWTIPYIALCAAVASASLPH